MICKKCGSQVNEGQKFCTVCGTKLRTPVYGQETEWEEDAVPCYQVLPKPTPWKAYMSFWKNYANFKGRSRRSEYWWTFLINALIAGVIGIGTELVAQIFWMLDDGAIRTAGTCLSGVFSLVALIPGWALSVRRLHDLGKSGRWIVLATGLMFVTAVLSGIVALAEIWFGGRVMVMLLFVIICLAVVILNATVGVYLIILYCKDGQRQTNQYGPSPKYVVR